MFGVVAAGRLVDTAPEQVSETEFLFLLESPETVNHLVVFMTGVEPFPEGLAASIHFCWPGLGWQLLGFLSNDRPSAIFKLTTPVADDVGAAPSPFGAAAAAAGGAAQIGISVQPIDELVHETPDTAAQAPTANDLKLFTTTMLESFYNFATSFAVARAEAVARADDTFVPLSCLNKWQERFRQKLALDPLFWKR